MIIENGASSFHTIYFYDENNATVTPSLATYSLINTDTDSYTISPTTITPTNARTNLTITNTENTITGYIEHRILEIDYTYNTTSKGVAKQSYIVMDTPITTTDILILLEGWTTDYTEPVNYDVTEDTVQGFLLRGLHRVAGYLKLSSPNSLDLKESALKEATITWTAGLLWNWKYTIDTPDATVEKYGDSLIVEAKSMLDTYMETHKSEDPGASAITWSTGDRRRWWGRARVYGSALYDPTGEEDDIEYLMYVDDSEIDERE